MYYHNLLIGITILIIGYLIFTRMDENFYFEPSVIGQGDFHINNNLADNVPFQDVMDSYVTGHPLDYPPPEYHGFS